MRLPIRRPALPRASSAMSGFFFCGMIEEPVEQESCSVTKPNSLVAQRITSSAIAGEVDTDHAPRRRRTRRRTSRDGGAVDRVVRRSRSKPSSARDQLRVQARGSGRRAHPQPYGESTTARACPSRAAARTSRSSGQAWASRWWDSSTGCACCRCVRPGMIAPRWASAWSTSASTRSRITPAGDAACVVEQVTSGPAWRSGRCATVRRAACRRRSGAQRARSASALESAVHVLVGVRGPERRPEV